MPQSMSDCAVSLRVCRSSRGAHPRTSRARVVSTLRSRPSSWTISRACGSASAITSHEPVGSRPGREPVRIRGELSRQLLAHVPKPSKLAAHQEPLSSRFRLDHRADVRVSDISDVSDRESKSREAAKTPGQELSDQADRRSDSGFLHGTQNYARVQDCQLDPMCTGKIPRILLSQRL